MNEIGRRPLLLAVFAIVLATAPLVGQMDWRMLPVTNSPPGRAVHAMAYDTARQRIVLFASWYVSNETWTWEWDGRHWKDVSPPSGSPPACIDHAMAYDAARKRIVLFEGSYFTNDTWEWDGTRWTRSNPAGSPPPRLGAAMAYDAARQRVVLFGGSGGNDTWEWDGRHWQNVTPPSAIPPVRDGHAMVYDAARKRVVLFGGGNHWNQRNDTWEWDGRSWTQCRPATSPPGRFDHAMAYDAARQRTVVYGGMYAPNDTWEWDGKNWTQLNPVTIPPPRAEHSMAFDAARNRVVLFGGSRQHDTWEWDGSNWKNVSPSAGSPQERAYPAVAHDRARRRIVLFGGQGVASSLTSFNDTWEWNGNAWTRCWPTTSPSPRSAHAMAWDAARHRTVLFGGLGGPPANAYLSDTWEWDGQTWTRHQPAVSPSPRSGHAMAYDATRRRVVLFGGSPSPWNYLSDTWEWDGTNWTLLRPAASPPPRCEHAMVWDPARQRIVLFGGQTNSPSAFQLNDTWEWDGRTWNQRNPTVRPPARYGHAMVHDMARQRTILFAGQYWPPGPHQRVADFLNDTWEWDGSAWSQRTPATRPWPRSNHGMAYDPVHGSIIAFGGLDLLGRTDETWEYVPRDLIASTHVVSVATGGNVKLALDAGVAHATKRYLVLGTMSGTCAIVLQGRVQVLPCPDHYFWFTLLAPNTLIAGSLGRLDDTGRATATIQVPKLPTSFIGALFHHAFVVLTSRLDYASTPVPLTLVK